MIAGIRRNQFTVVRLIRIFGVFSSIRNTLGDGFALGNVHCNYAGSSDMSSPPDRKKTGAAEAAPIRIYF